jgi:GR25 family glycosyltransferase involved in LPS biosynthesis
MLYFVVLFLCVTVLSLCIYFGRRSSFTHYVVSLDKDTERRNNVSKNVHIQEFYAVDGRKLDIPMLQRTNRVAPDCTLTKGEIACFLSHVYFLHKVQGSKTPVLILEDDVDVPSDLAPKVHELLSRAPADWEILFLGHNHYTNTPSHVEHDSSFQRVNMVYGAQAYLVNPRTITDEKIETLFPICRPYDIAFGDSFICYAVVAKMIELSPRFSNVSNTQGIK